jgi:type IV secretory pathway TrbD component
MTSVRRSAGFVYGKPVIFGMLLWIVLSSLFVWLRSTNVDRQVCVNQSTPYMTEVCVRDICLGQNIRPFCSEWAYCTEHRDLAACK